MTADLAERFVRMCERHQVVLQETARESVMRCPGVAGRGAHTTGEWTVVDRAKWRAYSRVSAVEGHKEELNMPLPKEPVSRAREQRQLAATKFVDGQGRRLWIRLERDPGRDDATRYRVRWQLFEGDGKSKGKTKAGVSDALANEKSATSAYNGRVEVAKRNGWVEQPTGVGLVRRLIFSEPPEPLPAPASKRK